MLISIDAKFLNNNDVISVALYTPSDSLYCEVVNEENLNPFHKFLWKIKNFSEITHSDVTYYYNNLNNVNKRIVSWYNKYYNNNNVFLINNDFRVWTYTQSLLAISKLPIIFEYHYKYIYSVPLNDYFIDLKRLSKTADTTKTIYNALDTAEMLYVAYNNLFG